MPQWVASGADRREAVERLLDGLAGGDDAVAISASVADLHRRHNTFPGEVYLRVAADALDLAGAGPEDPIPYEGLLETSLPECGFRGRENRKIQFAVLAASSLHGGLEADLLDEVIWWHTDDFWRYGLLAAVAIIRSCTARSGETLPLFVGRLAERHGIALDTVPPDA